MITTFRLGDMTVHRIIEAEQAYPPALEFLPNLTPELLDENRDWIQPEALDAEDRLILCFQSYVVRTRHHVILVDTCTGNDHHKARAVATRRGFLGRYCDTSTLCCFAQFPSASKGYVKRWDDGFRCDYVA